MKQKIKKCFLGLGLASIVGAGIVFINSIQKSMNSPAYWNETQIRNQTGRIDVPNIYGNRNSTSESWVLDVNNDQNCDALMFNRYIFQYSKGMKERLEREGFVFEHNAKEMSQELRESANQVLKAQQNFSRKYLREYNRLKE